MQRLRGLGSCSFQQPASMATEPIRSNLVTTTLGLNNSTEKIKKVCSNSILLHLLHKAISQKYDHLRQQVLKN